MILENGIYGISVTYTGCILVRDDRACYVFENYNYLYIHIYSKTLTIVNGFKNVLL